MTIANRTCQCGHAESWHNAVQCSGCNQCNGTGFRAIVDKAWTVPTVYVASYWHRNNDPIGGIVGFNQADVEKQTRQAMTEEYERSCEDCCCEECDHEDRCNDDDNCDCSCCEDTVRWGRQAFPVSLLEFMRDCPHWARQETLDSLRLDGWTYDPMP